MTFFTRAALLTAYALTLGNARGDECISDQAGLQAALMIEDNSKVFICADTIIEITRTVAILPTAKVTLECEKKGCEIAPFASFGGTLIQTLSGGEAQTSDHEVTFKGISFNGYLDLVFSLSGGVTKFERGKECRFFGSFATGGMFTVANGEVSIDGCDFVSNFSVEPLFSARYSKLLFKDVSFSRNGSLRGLVSTFSSDLTMKNVKVTENEAITSNIFELNKSRAKF